ncbi:MAG: D-2-hydroxyacid dehydrogenase [Armatimonadetes bacterium]|nr:D-2-hydroxyacid dehydrogenase [Armatimonadota bacterium]NIM23741.1 D-2-hydroxyacid dehydrogenase [Armatimonadota bacterium]NIM67618.1 D-2-hydroxyacid dehydrogenase [Armatimonadota bacterium]NIM76139.1 D-2-hydroxyacid dehydrogenase [Armatimonadota bacterium]NIN05824.1 D-2-hydroxyacid dehydrogenase [Armatimonadota bacterium]
MKLLVVRLSADDVEKMKAAAPSVEIRVAQSDGAVAGEMADAEIYLPGPREPEHFANAKKLRWVHCMWAGMDHSPFLSALGQDVIVTNSAGVFAVPIAEHSLALITAFSRGIHFCLRRPKEEVWGGEEHWKRLEPHISDLEGATLGVIGHGGIGRAAAQRAKAFGMRILALARHPRQGDGIADAVRGPEGLEDLLKESDYVLISCPLTEETQGLIGAHELSLMKPNAVIVNIARGGIIDEAALISALQSRKIRGAGLDVTSQEPLPFDSPLWEMENVIITPHVGGSSPMTWRRQLDLFLENLRRYAAARPLLNVVDREIGY